MANCVKLFCGRLSGRRHFADLDGQLLLSPGPDETVRCAEQGLRQVARLRQTCDALSPVLTGAMAMKPATATVAGEVALSAIRARLTELEAMLRAVAVPCDATSSPMPGTALAPRRRRIREVVSCIAAEGNERTWRPGRLVITNEGLHFEGKQDVAKEVDNVQIVPWYDVQQVSTRDPTLQVDTASNVACGSLLYEADLNLRRPPGRLRLQFGAGEPLRTLSALWREEGSHGDGLAGIPVSTINESTSSQSSSPKAPEVTQAQFPSQKGSAMEACEGLLGDLLRAGCKPTCQVRSVYRAPVQLPPGKTLADVFMELSRNDDESMIARLWQARNVTEWAALPWQPHGKDLIRKLTFRLPLRPQPLAPKNTRMAVIYHLSRGGDGTDGAATGPIVFTEMTRSLDVPYASSFSVQIQHVFSGSPGTTAGGANEIEVDNLVGVAWTSRCMVKSLVESSASSETVIGSKAVIGQLLDSLSGPSVPTMGT